MEENPYQLAEEIDGIGFKRADEIAKKAGVSLIKTPLENALNDLTVFVGYEAFKVYGSSSKKGYLPPSKEVQND